jgi:hypothetical protein
MDFIVCSLYLIFSGYLNQGDLWAVHVRHMGEKRSSHKIFVANPCGNLQHGLKDNTETDLREILIHCEGMNSVCVRSEVLMAVKMTMDLTGSEQNLIADFHDNETLGSFTTEFLEELTGLGNALYKVIQIYIILRIFTLNPCSLILLTAVCKGPVKSDSSTSVRAECSLYGPSKQY